MSTERGEITDHTHPLQVRELSISTGPSKLINLRLRRSAERVKIGYDTSLLGTICAACEIVLRDCQADQHWLRASSSLKFAFQNA